MGDSHRPRHGSLQFWPRKRAKNETPRIRNWVDAGSQKIMGFAGYKAGMTHVMAKDNVPNSMTKGEIISSAVTVIECPPMKPLCLRFYKANEYATNVVADVYAKNIDKEVLRQTKIQKKSTEIPSNYDYARLVVYTKPGLAGFGKKKPDIFEVSIGKEDKDIDSLKKLLEKDIKISEIFKQGQLIDVHSVTKGKGFQGTVKRFGVPIRQHKSEKTKRGIGTLGPWHPRRVRYSVPQSGKMGYHLRTEYNKAILLIGNDAAKVNPKGGFLNYGLIKNDYILLKGSVPGPGKRVVILTEAQRAYKRTIQQEIKQISIESKQ